MTNKPFYIIMLGGLVLFLGFVFFVGVKSNDETAKPPEPVAFDPAAAYAKSCVACHGGNLEGTAGAPSLVGLTLTADEVADIIKNGKPADQFNGMPPGMFKGTDEEIQALANWVLEHK